MAQLIVDELSHYVTITVIVSGYHAALCENGCNAGLRRDRQVHQRKEMRYDGRISVYEVLGTDRRLH